MSSEVSTSTAILKDSRALSENPLDLYEYLWSKSNEIHPIFSFFLPETIIFRHQTPLKWIFTSKKEKGKILSKKRKHLCIEHVLKELSSSKYTSSQNIPEKDIIVATYAYIQENEPDGENKIIFEHLTKERLAEVLCDQSRPPMSILQRFIPTKTGYNHMIMSIFSSENCIIRKCVNTHQVYDPHVDTPLRTATFEGGHEDSCYTRDINTGDIKQLIEKINREISLHLRALVGEILSRFVSYFKFSVDGQIYLIMSSLISFDNPTQTCTRYYGLSLPCINNNVETARQKGVMKTCTASANTSKCLNCSQAFQKEQVSFLVTYRSIMKYFESASLPCFNGDDLKIPSLFRNIYPLLTEERYQQLRTNSNFLYNSVSLCRGCADLINSTAMKLSSTDQTYIRNRLPPDTLLMYSNPSQSVPSVATKQDQAVPRKPSQGNADRNRPVSTYGAFSRNHRPHSARNQLGRKAPSFDFKTSAEQESAQLERSKRAQPETVSSNENTSSRPSTGNPSFRGIITAPQIPISLRPERRSTSVGFCSRGGSFRRQIQSLYLNNHLVDPLDAEVSVAIRYKESVNTVPCKETHNLVKVTRVEKMDTFAHQAHGQHNQVVHENDDTTSVSALSQLELLDFPELTEEERQVLQETLRDITL